jgi:plasmid stabilization system protein ParE
MTVRWTNSAVAHLVAIREVIEGPYRVIYEVAGNDVRVLAVIHGARLLPQQPPKLGNVEQGDAADSR